MYPGYVQFDVSAVVTDAVTKTITVEFLPFTDYPCAIKAIETSIIVTKTGAGTGPTCDVTLQCSPDQFATAGLIEDVINFTQATADTSETKSVTDADAVLKRMGNHRRIKVVAAAASGDVTFHVAVRVTFYGH